MLHILIGLLAFASSVIAAPSSSKELLSLPPAKVLGKRDPCDQQGATYQLYKDYDQNACPAKNPSNYGDCFPLHDISFDNPSGLPCGVFCQQHVEFSYGQEQILPLSICHHPITCTVTETITKITQHQFGFTAGLGSNYSKIFTAGASYTYTWSTQKTNTQSLAVTPKEGECGYFSFLPHIVTTCGLFADSPNPLDDACPSPKQHFNKLTYGCSSDFVTIESASGDNRHQGATVFVYTDCVTDAPIPCDGQTSQGSKQDEAYCQPGVALPRDVLLAQLGKFPNATATQSGLATETFKDPDPTLAAQTDQPVSLFSLSITTGDVPVVTPTDTAVSSSGGTQATSTSKSPTATSTSKSSSSAGTGKSSSSASKTKSSSSKSASSTASASATSTSAAGSCQAGTIDSTADCDSLCAGGTCTSGVDALGQTVVTCSGCP